MIMSNSTKAKATAVEPCDQLEVKHIDVPEVVSNVSSVKAWVDGEEVIGTYTLAAATVGDATAEDIVAGKKAWVNGVEITGTHV